MSIRLPGAVDVPGMTAEQFLTNSQSRSYKFSDGQDAFHARFQYGGNLAITAPLGAEQIDRLVKKQRQRFSTVQTAVEKGELRAGSGAKLKLSKLDRADPAFGWRIFNETEVTLVAYPTIPGHGLAHRFIHILPARRSCVIDSSAAEKSVYIQALAKAVVNF
jgi:hypothetical protein